MKRFTLLTIIALLLVACAADAPPISNTPETVDVLPTTTALPMADSPDPTLIQANLPRQLAPDVDGEHIAQLTAANNQFAFDLYHAVRQNSDDNLIYSPYSISLAFSMVYAGARGHTEAEMAQALHFLPQNFHHQAFNALDQQLAALSESNKDGETHFQLHIANAVWGQRGYPFHDAFLATLAEQYGAGLRVGDFAGRPAKSVQEINDWIAEQTADRIQDILLPEAVNPDTRMVLANAIYFNARWRTSFWNTQDDLFTLLDGRQTTVPMMQKEQISVSYADQPAYQIVILPYISTFA